jgi:hypothetical protein
MWEKEMPSRRHLILSGLAATLAGRAASATVAAAQTAPPISEYADMPLDPAVLGSAVAPLPDLQIAPEFYPLEVRVKRTFLPGSIIIVSSKHFLYFITRKGHAIRYGVAVGKAELVFRGRAVVGEKVEWPSWKPTPEMVERNPAAYAKYAEKGMEGGPRTRSARGRSICTRTASTPRSASMARSSRTPSAIRCRTAVSAWSTPMSSIFIGVSRSGPRSPSTDCRRPRAATGGFLSARAAAMTGPWR